MRGAGATKAEAAGSRARRAQAFMVLGRAAKSRERAVSRSQGFGRRTREVESQASRGHEQYW
jgi:hypothetical protein